MHLEGAEYVTVNGLATNMQIMDFWRHYFSDVTGPICRDQFSRFIISSAVSVHVAPPGDAPFISRSGVRVVTASASYVQSADPEHPEHIFFALPVMDKADACIFCVCTSQCENDNALDVSRWHFYILRVDNIVSFLSKQNKSLCAQGILTYQSMRGIENTRTEYLDLEHELKKLFTV